MSEKKLTSENLTRQFSFHTENDIQEVASNGHVLATWINNDRGFRQPLAALTSAYAFTVILGIAVFATGNMTPERFRGIGEIGRIYSNLFQSEASKQAIAAAQDAVEGIIPEFELKNWAFDPTNVTKFDDGRTLHAKYFWASKSPKSDNSISDLKKLQDMRDIQLSLLTRGKDKAGSLVSADVVRNLEKENAFDSTVWIARLHAKYDAEKKPAVVTYPANGLFKNKEAVDALSTTGLLALTSTGFYVMGFVDGVLSANFINDRGECTWVYGAKLDGKCESAFPYIHYPEIGDPVNHEEQTAVLNDLKSTVYGQMPDIEIVSLFDRLRVSQELTQDPVDTTFLNVPRHSERSLTSEQWSKLLQNIDQAFQSGEATAYLQSGSFDGVIAQNLRKAAPPLEVDRRGFFQNAEAVAAMGHTGAIGVGSNNSKYVSAYVDGRLSMVGFHTKGKGDSAESDCTVIYGDNGGLKGCQPGILNDVTKRDMADIYGDLPKELEQSKRLFDGMPRFPADRENGGISAEAVERTLKFAFRNYAQHEDRAREWVVEKNLPVKPEIIREKSFQVNVEAMTKKSFITLPQFFNGFFVSAYVDGEFSLYGVEFNESYAASITEGEEADKGLLDDGAEANSKPDIATCYAITGKPMTLSGLGVSGLKNGTLTCSIGYHQSFDGVLDQMLQPEASTEINTNK